MDNQKRQTMRRNQRKRYECVCMLPLALPTAACMKQVSVKCQ